MYVSESKYRRRRFTSLLGGFRPCEDPRLPSKGARVLVPSNYYRIEAAKSTPSYKSRGAAQLKRRGRERESTLSPRRFAEFFARQSSPLPNRRVAAAGSARTLLAHYMIHSVSTSSPISSACPARSCVSGQLHFLAASAPVCRLSPRPSRRTAGPNIFLLCRLL